MPGPAARPASTTCCGPGRLKVTAPEDPAQYATTGIPDVLFGRMLPRLPRAPRCGRRPTVPRRSGSCPSACCDSGPLFSSITDGHEHHCLRFEELRYLQEGDQVAGPLRRAVPLRRLPRQQAQPERFWNGPRSWGLAAMVNKSSTTWRQRWTTAGRGLRGRMEAAAARYPQLIKRPLVVTAGEASQGFRGQRLQGPLRRGPVMRVPSSTWPAS